jgi:hypothetical protein
MTDASEPKVVSMSGAPLIRHGAEKPFEAPQGEMCLEQISAHVEQHLGPIETVFHEIVSDTVHIDILVVKPTESFPYWRLVTSGMSDLAMKVPDGVDAPRHLELMVTLPADWRMGEADFRSEAWYWPLRLLKILARLPHKFDTWLGFGHTMPNGDPEEPYAANTKLSGVMLVPPATVDDGFLRLVIDEHKTIGFLSLVPLYKEEMALKLRDGADALIDRLVAIDVNDIVDPARRNAARKRFGLW